MMKNNRHWPMTAACIWTAVYAVWAVFRICTAHGVLWSGIPAVTAWPHALCAAAAAALCIIGLIQERIKPLQCGTGCLWLAAALFPPYHVLLLVPMLLSAAWILVHTPQNA